MGVFGFSMEQLYMYTLLLAGALTVLCVFFGEDPDSEKVVRVFQPVLIFSFFTCSSAIGFLLETATEFNEWSVLGISVLAALLLNFLLSFFVLFPCSYERNTQIEESLSGQVGNVTTHIPVDGYGEVVFETYAGKFSKRATGYSNESFDQNEKVVVLEVSEDTLYVRAYQTIDLERQTKRSIR